MWVREGATAFKATFKGLIPIPSSPVALLLGCFVSYLGVDSLEYLFTYSINFAFGFWLGRVLFGMTERLGRRIVSCN